MMEHSRWPVTKFINLILLAAFSLLLWTDNSAANNLSLSNFTVSSVNTSANTITFSFDLTQENSWKNSTNQDAVWLFIKYSTDGGASWLPASMSGSGLNPSGFSAPTNFEIIVPSDETGFFLQRTNQGTGSVSATGARVVWDYGQDGVSDAVAIAANTLNKIFGIEMVYIPAGSFYAGDGNSSSEFRFKQGSGDNDPWYVASENALTTTNSAADGNYYTSSGASGEDSSGSSFLVPASFPKGYAAFYLMKYELSESQWVAFFNSLNSSAKLNRDITAATAGGKNSDAVVNRNTIAWDDTKPESPATTERPARAMSYLSWPDLLAYADWAALRPMTELEYEKAARGKDISPVVNEYVWGSTSLTAAGVSEISPDDEEDGSEIISNPNSNVNRTTLAWSSGDGRSGGDAQGQQGPLRSGIFAGTGDSRVTAGAGYYGNLDLSGNLWEPVVTLGRSEGRSFLGTHGDGRLSAESGFEGNATNSDWPGIDGTDSDRGVTGTVGAGYRGGDFRAASSQYLQTSSRSFAAKDPDSQSDNQRFDSGNNLFYGGRLVRTSPL